jgi:hypothetical protein
MKKNCFLREYSVYRGTDRGSRREAGHMEADDFGGGFVAKSGGAGFCYRSFAKQNST